MILQCLEVTSHFDCVVLTAVNKETQFRIIFLMKSNVQQIKCFILTSVCKQEDAAGSSCNLGQMSQCVKKKCFHLIFCKISFDRKLPGRQWDDRLSSTDILKRGADNKVQILLPMFIPENQSGK